VGKHIKEITIYLDTNAAVVVIDDEPPSTLDEQQDHWDDELQDALDDYD
jgi:hypothetical protein